MSSAAAAPTKSPKKRAISQKRKTSLSVSDLILKAASPSAERGGVSLVALKKALESGGYDVKKNRARILLAIRRLVASKSLVQIKGTGASGSFKLNKKPPTPLKKRVVKKKPKAKMAKRVGTRKAAEAAAPVVKKSPKKKMAKTLKKAKRPAAAKKPKSPRTLKRAVMSTRSRAAAKK